MSRAEKELSTAVYNYGIKLWLMRFHADKLPREVERFSLLGVQAFERDWPEEAIEISKEVGWPDDDSKDADGPDSGLPRVRPVPSGPTG